MIVRRLRDAFREKTKPFGGAAGSAGAFGRARKNEPNFRKMPRIHDVAPAKK
jgi:hypothetical protein